MPKNKYDKEHEVYGVTEAFYVVNEDARPIKGIPSHGMVYFGEYTGPFPYLAASKAFTGIQKYMKKWNGTGTVEWFPDYDPKEPPEIIFTMENVETGWTGTYHGTRVPAHQGKRTVVNDDGRVRNYQWENKVVKLK